MRRRTKQRRSNYSFFHMMMLLGSSYMAMMLTSWNVVGSNTDSIKTMENGNISMIAKFLSEFVCILLYFWTLIAKYICRDRDFGE